MTSLFSALQFLTTLPLPSRGPVERPAFSLAYFPLVGILLGAILAGLDWFLGLFLARPLVNGLLIVALIMLTGGLHLDGFMDTCDALPGAQPTTRRLEILRDLHVGSFGILGLISLLLVKYLALDTIPPPLRTGSLLLMPTLGRWAMALALLAFPYARSSGLGRALKDGATLGRLALATLLTLATATLALRGTGLAALGAAALLALLLGWYFRQRLGGLTGDTYGAINEVVEVAVLIVIPLASTYDLWRLP
jgi:adenosylcobinamide-GDP ribazoletransferase